MWFLRPTYRDLPPPPSIAQSWDRLSMKPSRPGCIFCHLERSWRKGESGARASLAQKLQAGWPVPCAWRSWRTGTWHGEREGFEDMKMEARCARFVLRNSVPFPFCGSASLCFSKLIESGSVTCLQKPWHMSPGQGPGATAPRREMKELELVPTFFPCVGGGGSAVCLKHRI